MDKHTPGPWTFTEGGGGHRHCHSINGQPPECREIAIITVLESHHNDNYANDGRLIASAPDMLDALKALVRVADRKTVEFEAARAAIAKATGVWM